MSAVARKINFGMGPKYKNQKTTLIVADKAEKFDSLREAKAFGDLTLLQKAGRIRNLERQVQFKIEINGAKVCTYRCDFTFDEYAHGEWKAIVADAKGYQTPVYRLKKKLMAIVLGIEIREL